MLSRLATWLAAFALPAAAAGTHGYTDLWWNPQESGWGTSIVQQDQTAFVTLFVYTPDGKPTWYVAPAADLYATDADGRPAFRGALYRVEGPWLGGPFEPAKVKNQVVGTLNIEPFSEGRLRLYYEAEGVAVSKTIQRQTFAIPDFGANYSGVFILRQALPGKPPFGTRDYAADILLHIDAGQVFMRVEEPLGRCQYRGPYVASGRLARIAGQFTCDGGITGTFTITDFELTEHGFSGYLRTSRAGDEQFGRFAAARY